MSEKKQSNGTVRIVLGSIAGLFALMAVGQAFSYMANSPSEIGYGLFAVAAWGGLSAWLLITGLNQRRKFTSS
jgi:hypothetical protein